LQEAAESLDYIMDTIPVAHPLEPYLALLKTNGKLVMLGVVTEPLHFVSPLLILGISLSSSMCNLQPVEKIHQFFYGCRFILTQL